MDSFVTEIYLKADLFQVYMYKQLIKFLAIGFLGMIINLLVFYLLVELIGILYIVGAVISYIAGITNNFFWNKHWTFQSKERKYKEQYIKYLIISISSLVINLIILSILVEIFNLWYMFSQAAAVTIAGLNNFFWNKYWTFRS